MKMPGVPIGSQKSVTSDVVMEYYTRELNAAHDHLDGLGIARMIDGEKLSISQRCEIARKDVGALHVMVMRLRAAMGLRSTE